MIENLIDPTANYFHPLTKKVVHPKVMHIDVEGNLSNVSELVIEKVKSLTAEDIVNYYYTSCHIPRGHQNMSRDIGSVKFLVNKMGLDIALFCIEALITSYMDSDDRDSYPPTLIKAAEMTAYAADKLGQVKYIAQQYGG